MTSHLDNLIAPAPDDDDRAPPLVCALTLMGLSGLGWWVSITLALAAYARYSNALPYLSTCNPAQRSSIVHAAWTANIGTAISTETSRSIVMRFRRAGSTLSI